MIAIDTNLLIYAHRCGLPEHRAARRAIQKASVDPRGWGIPFSCIAEFWSVVTHPESRRRLASGQGEGLSQGAGAGGRRARVDAARRLLGQGDQAG